MTPAARSMLFFAVYLYITGFILLVFPEIFLRLLNATATEDVWLRIVGVLVAVIAFYYHRTAIQNNTAFFRQTVPTRLFVALCFLVFAFGDFHIPRLAIFAAIDLLGAFWTWKALTAKNEEL